MSFFKDMIQALFLKDPKPEDSFREAVGVNIDADETGWRKLSGDAGRDLSPMTQDRQRELAVYLWATNPLANRLIELPVAYLLAEGVRLTVPDAEAQDWLDAFWRDPINRMNMKLPKKVRELALHGEQCWPVFVNSITGHMRLGYLDPALIEKVVTDPDNIEQPIGIVARAGLSGARRGKTRRYRVLTGGPEEVFTSRTREIRQTFTDGDCFFFTINDLSNATRGHSDLLPVIDWLDVYDQALYGEAERWDYLRSFIWDVTLKGATADEVKKRAAEITVPTSGGTRVHNDAEEWKTEAPDLQATNGAEFARLFRNHILGALSIPEHWYGGGGDVNRNTASSMDETTEKVMAMRQQVWKHILEMVGQYQVDMRLRCIFGDAYDNTDPNYAVTAEFPEIATKDTSVYAAALQQVIIGAGAAVTQGLLSQESAVAIIVFCAGRLGVKIDAEEELKRVRESGFSPEDYRLTLETEMADGALDAPVNTVAAPEEAITPAAAEPALALDADAAVPELSLNGAQVTAMLDVVSRVAAGLLPRETAVAILETAFNIPHDKAEKVLGTVGRGFVPASPPEAGGTV